MDENKIVLCGANAYEKKYYFNEEQFKMIPDSIKQELHVICVLFTEEVGGVFTIAFEEDEFNGSPYLNQNLSATLTVTQIQDEKYIPIWPNDIAAADLIYPAEYK